MVWLGTRKLVTRDRSADFQFKINRWVMLDIGYRHGMHYRRQDAKQPLAFNGEEVYIRFVGYCNHVMRQVPVPQPSGPRHLVRSLVVVGGNR